MQKTPAMIRFIGALYARKATLVLALTPSQHNGTYPLRSSDRPTCQWELLKYEGDSPTLSAFRSKPRGGFVQVVTEDLAVDFYTDTALYPVLVRRV